MEGDELLSNMGRSGSLDTLWSKRINDFQLLLEGSHSGAQRQYAHWAIDSMCQIQALVSELTRQVVPKEVHHSNVLLIMTKAYGFLHFSHSVHWACYSSQLSSFLSQMLIKRIPKKKV